MITFHDLIHELYHALRLNEIKIKHYLDQLHDNFKHDLASSF